MNERQEEKEIRYKIITEKDLNEIIESKIRSNRKIAYVKELILPGIIIVIVSVVLSTMIDTVLQLNSSEKYANLDPNAWVENDTVILKINNYAQSHSAKNIRIYGDSSLGEDILIDHIQDQILAPGGNLERKIPLEVVSKVTPYATLETHPNISTSPLLEYYIECDGCVNDFAWKNVKIPKNQVEEKYYYRPWGTEVIETLMCQSNYTDYHWKEYNRDIPIKSYFD